MLFSFFHALLFQFFVAFFFVNQGVVLRASRKPVAGIEEDEKSLVPQLPRNTFCVPPERFVRLYKKNKIIQSKEIKGERMEVGSRDVHSGASDVNTRKGRNDDEGGERLR